MAHIHNRILPEGTQIGVYEIKGISKVTAFDITYRAWNHHLKEQVKIREYFPDDFAQRTPDQRGVEPKSAADKENYDYGLKAFLDQAEVLIQIEHPHIVSLENILPFNGTAYMIMGLREGMPLSRLVQSHASFAETELKFILVSILSALQKLHEHNIVHGDIQPATILIGKEGVPLLVNAASARLAIAARTARYTEELAAGYAAPERYEPANVIGPATDFYALGATIYACITHRQPPDVQSRKGALNRGEPDPMALSPESADTSYSQELLDAMNWMLRPDYIERPQSASEILALLKSDRVSNSSDSVTSRQTSSEVAASRSIAKNAVLLGVVLGIAALVGVGVWLHGQPAQAPAMQSTAMGEQTSVQTTAAETAAGSAPAIEQPSDQPAGRPESEGLAVVASDPEGTDVAQAEVDSAQQLTAAAQPQSQQLPSARLADSDTISRHLKAAEKALKAGRLTTPAKDNAHKYYQMVLTLDPDNPQARAGQQKIVDQYVQFMDTARARGQRNIAKRYLQRAESVLPNDPRLERIRAQLMGGR